MKNSKLRYNKVNNALCKFCKQEGNFFTLLMLLLLSFTLRVNAHPVDMRLAREIGAKFVNSNTTMKVSPEFDLQLVTTYRTANNDEAFHVFNTPKGFVIVAANDCATPILGYSNEEHFDIDNIPIQMQEYLQGFVEQIQYGIDNHLQADETIARQWNLVRATGHLKEQRAIKEVSPMLTDKWYQDCYYNERCPEDPNGPCGHVLVGCTAVAFGQIMRYWGYPINGSGSMSYTPTGYPKQEVNFAETTYQWGSMPNRLKASSDSIQVNAVATMLWHCGVAIQIEYGPNGTNGEPSRVHDVLKNYFNYSSDLYCAFMSDYSYDTWLSMVKNCLDNGRPIYYCGYDSEGNNGHSFVCDGYDSNDLLHFNWGWSGHGNNEYFALGALHINHHDYSYDNYAIFDIHPKCPPGTSYQVTAMASPSDGGTIEGAGVYSCGENCTLTAVPDSSYMFCSWTENGVIVSTDPSYTFNVNDTVELVANFVSDDVCSLVFNLVGPNGEGWNGKALTVSYSSGCDSYEELTFDSDTATTITRNVLNGIHVVLGWISDDYSDNCSFSVKYLDGNTIYESESDSLSSSFSYEFDVTCGETYYYITTLSNPSTGGFTIGEGSYLQGSNCVLTALADSSYSFVNWTKNGELVSSSPTFSITVTEDATYVANFTEIATPEMQVNAEYHPKSNDSDSLNVLISWSDYNSTYRIYRSNCDGEEMQLIADSITEIQYIDTNWVDLAPGHYKYGIEVAPYMHEDTINWIDPNNLNNRASWHLVTTFNAADTTQFGVATDGANIYTSNEVCSDSTYSFFKYDLMGNIIEGFNIDSCANILDLTYDGQYFYGGANDSLLYCIDLTNHNLINTTITSCSNILHCSYDPVNDGFWVGGENSLMLIDRSGNIITDGPDIDSISVSGTGYYNDENGNPHLYLFAQAAESAKVFDYNMLTDTIGDMLMDFTTMPGYDSGIGGGAFIGEYNGKMAFLVNVQQSPSLISIYEPGNIQDVYWSNCIEKEIDLFQQSIELQAGWNWWSNNLDITLDQLKEALVTALPDTASITIKSQTQNTSYNGFIWRGLLNEINSSEMYEIQVPESCTITLTGMYLNQIELTIRKGSNWIALPISESISLTDAFGTFPVMGDIVKSKDGRATFTDTMWRGTFQNLEPGQGYIYKSASEEIRTFSFPASTE